MENLVKSPKRSRVHYKAPGSTTDHPTKSLLNFWHLKSSKLTAKFSKKNTWNVSSPDRYRLVNSLSRLT